MGFDSRARKGRVSQIHVFLETPITFDVTGRTVHSPMVQLKVAGTTTKLILDTGSSDHVLTIALADRAGLKPVATEPGTDHAGAAVPSWALGEVSVEIENTTLPLQQVVAIEGPPQFEEWGVGGFLSPQKLHPTAVVVIDLAENQLVLVEGDSQDVLAWLLERHPTLRLLSLEREYGDTLATKAALEPFAPVVAMLNTGSSATEFATETVPGLRGRQAEETGLGLSGTSIESEEVTGQTLLVADARFPLSLVLVREHMPPPHAMMGMDVLLGTVLAFTADSSEPIQWMVPAAGETRLAP